MPTPWLKRIQKTKQLTVFNKAGAWSDSVDTAIGTFNALPFCVTLVAEKKEEKSANIVVLLANGPQQYKYYGDTVKTDPSFKSDMPHGQTSTLGDPRTHEIFFAAIFLPGKIPKLTKGQKEVIIVHEFIHASGGLTNDEHDSTGIFFGYMTITGDGMLESLPEEGAKLMPPIRLGPRTATKMQTAWPGGLCI